MCMLAFYGLDPQLDGVSFSERWDLAEKISGFFEKYHNFSRAEKEARRDLSITLCEGIRNPPDVGEDNQPPRLRGISSALKDVVKKGLPVTPARNPALLLKECMQLDIANMNIERIARAIVQLNKFLATHLDQFDDEKLGRVARIYFCHEPGYRGVSLTKREESIASIYGVTPRAVRGWRVEVISGLAWQIYPNRVPVPDEF